LVALAAFAAFGLRTGAALGFLGKARAVLRAPVALAFLEGTACTVPLNW
jgi:hypothetical protein